MMSRVPTGQNRIPERLLARLWQKKAARQEWLRTHSGTRVRMIYPGSVGTGAGLDFRNALLEVEGEGLVRGDVEIHVRQKDWQSHGHGGDPNYNGVVLHAALEVESHETQLQSGRHASVVSLLSLLASEEPLDPEPQGPGLEPAEPGLTVQQLFATEGPGVSGGATPSQLAQGDNTGLWAVLGRSGYSAPRNAEEMGVLLDAAGDHRFLAKSGYFAAILREQNWQQTIYENLLEGLGYRNNQQPFLKLASRASYGALKRGVERLPREGRAQALGIWLTEMSGLSPPVAASPGQPQSRTILPRVGFGAPLLSSDWHCFRLRPSNHTRRRIMGAAAWLDRFLDQGLVAGLAGPCGAGSAKGLLAALMVPAEVQGQPALIGKDRAGDLAVNVVLPFFHALERVHPGGVPSGDPLGFYRRFAKLQDNELIREMKAQLFHPSWGESLSTQIANSARRQQGLLRLQAVLTGAA